MKEVEVGRVEDYFKNIGVVAIEITAGEIRAGDTLHFIGHTTDFLQKIESIQIEHEKVEKAGAGDTIGIKVRERVRTHDKVNKVIED